MTEVVLALAYVWAAVATCLAAVVWAAVATWLGAVSRVDRNKWKHIAEESVLALEEMPVTEAKLKAITRIWKACP